MNKSDWTLLAIALAENAALTPVQLQKALFLIGKTLPAVDQSGFYTFKPYNYGPFCQSIYADAEKLSVEGLVEIVAVPDQSWSNYRITEIGVAKAKALLDNLDDAQSQYLTGLVQWITELSFEQLLSFIYEKYPEYAVNSMFRVRK